MTKRLIRIPWIVGVLVFFAVLISLHSFFDLSARCESGWKSPSIGKRGACSHHGGVDHTLPNLAFFISVSAAIGTTIVSRKLGNKVNVRENANREDAEQRRAHNFDYRVIENTDDVLNIHFGHAKLDGTPAPADIPPCPIHGSMVDCGDLWACRYYPNCQYYFKKGRTKKRQN
jgi:hypothetical protein